MKKSSSSVLAVFIALQLSLAGCHRSQLPAGAASPSVNELISEKSLTCLTKLKREMKSFDLAFDLSASARMGYDLASATSDLVGLREQSPSFSAGWNEEENAPKSISVERTVTTPAGSVSGEMTVAAGELGSDDVFELELSLAKNASQGSISVDQTFGINLACEKRLKETSINRVEFEEAQALVEVSELHPGDQAGSFKKNRTAYALPKDGKSTHSLENVKTAGELTKAISADPTKALYTLVPGAGVITFKISESSPVRIFDRILGREQTADRFDIVMDLNGESFANGALLFSQGSAFGSSKFGDDESLNINEELWESYNLKAKTQTDNKVVIDPAILSGQGRSVVTLKSNRPYEYANLARYWKVESQKSEDEAWANSVRMMSVQPTAPIFSSSALVQSDHREKHPYLKASRLVQSDAPELKALSAKLAPYLHATRWQMALRIAEVVTSEMTYDYSSLKSGDIYPLSTLDVLSRKTGVCQHFANLFAALGRSVGLPTRIVVGHHISESGAGAHAWNEIEVADGVWLPIEPQSKDLLLTEGAYLPQAVSVLLETGEYSAADVQALGFFKFEYVLTGKTGN